MALPKRTTSASPPTIVRPGCASCGVQPFAHGFHQADERAALVAFQPNERPDDDQADQRRGLGQGEGVLHQLADLEAARVDPGEEKNQEDGDELLRRKTDRIGAKKMDRPDEIMLRRDHRQKDPGEFCKGDRDRRDRPGLNDEKKRPAKEKSDRRSVGLAQEHILPAGARQHRRQLGATERAGDGHEPGHRPGEQQPAGRADQPGRFGRGDENARADHRADHDHGGIERSEPAHQLFVRRFHSSGRRAPRPQCRPRPVGSQIRRANATASGVSPWTQIVSAWIAMSAAVDRPHHILVQHAEDARGCFLGVVQKRVRLGARDERAVGLIIAIGKNFPGNAQLDRLAGAGERAIVRGEKNERAIDRQKGVRHGFGQGRVARRHVVERAVRFDVMRVYA